MVLLHATLGNTIDDLNSYVEMLENQQSQLVSGLQELYRRLQDGQGWSGSPLKETSTGSPLTHDILERLGALKQDGQSTTEMFEENLEALQQKLIANGAGFMQRETSFDNNSEIDHVPSYEQNNARNSPAFVNPFQNSQAFPPTPPTQSPHPRMMHTSSPLKSQFPVEVTQMAQFPTQWPSDFDDNMDLMTYEPTSDMNIDAMAAYASQMHPNQTAINPWLTMKNWDPQQDMAKYFNSNVLV